LAGEVVKGSPTSWRESSRCTRCHLLSVAGGSSAGAGGVKHGGGRIASKVLAGCLRLLLLGLCEHLLILLLLPTLFLPLRLLKIAFVFFIL
jgi:hypothetical protein